jgi:hypothetical protein
MMLLLQIVETNTEAIWREDVLRMSMLGRRLLGKYRGIVSVRWTGIG